MVCGMGNEKGPLREEEREQLGCWWMEGRQSPGLLGVFGCCWMSPVPSITHLVLVARRDGEDGAAVHLPHEELGHPVTRGTRPGSAMGHGLSPAAPDPPEPALCTGGPRSPKHPPNQQPPWAACGQGDRLHGDMCPGCWDDGVPQGPSPRDSWPKVPYVLLKDTAMVSTAFSNSRLSVSLLDS